MEEAKCPVEDCQLPIDLVLKSSDEVLIGAHKTNLDNFSDGFAPADTTSNLKEPVELTEDGETLNRLMQFTHKHSYPDIYLLPQAALFSFADAAEKYMVHSAMAVANVCIRARVGEFSSRALAYSTKYDYTAIVDLAAPSTIGYELEAMRGILNDPRALSAWLQYKMTYLERSTNLFNRVATSAADPSQAAPRWLRTEGECQNWAQYASQVQLSLSHPVLTNLCLFKGTTAGLLFQRHTLQCRTYGCTCGEIAVQWRADAVGLLSAIPSLSTFLGR